MRRFEFSDGKSNKFWEISSDSSSFTTRWGRIGTDGQTKTKDAADPAAEVAKQIKGKTKKGYVEVAGASAPAAAPAPVAAAPVAAAPVAAAPKPKPAPKAKAPEPVVVPDQVVLASIPAPASRVEGDQPPVGLQALMSEAACWEVLGGTHRENWGRGLKHAKGKARELQEGCRKLLDGALPALLTADDLAVFIVMTGQAEAAVHLAWNRDPLLAVEVGLSSAVWHERYEWNRKRESYIDARSPADREKLFCANAVWLQVGRLVAFTDEATRARVVARVEQTLTQVKGMQRLDIACGFPQYPDWARTHLEAGRLGDGTWNSSVGNALRVLNLPELVYQLTDELLTQLGRDYSTYQLVQAHASAVVDNLGLAAVPSLERMWKTCTEDYQYKHVAESMARIVSPDAAAAFARNIEHKHIRSVAVEYLQANRDLAIPALAATTDSRSDGMGAALLGMLVRQDPVRALGLCSTTGQQTSVRTFILDHQPANQADLPPVLAHTPWLSRVAPVAVKPVALTMLEAPESVAWSPEMRAQYSRSVTDPQRRKVPAKIDLWRLHYYVHDDIVAETFETAELDWGYAGKDEVLGVLARTDLAGINGWVKQSRAKLNAAIHALRWIRSPRVAPLIAEARARYKTCRGPAREWLTTFPEEAAIGLIPMALGKGGESAQKALLVTHLAGHTDTIREVADRYGAQAREQVEVLLSMDPLQDLPKKLPKLPKWLEARLLPAPELRAGGALPPEAVEAICTMLSFSPIDPAYVGIEEVQQACTPSSLSNFSWNLFQLWRAADGSGKTDWCMTQLAHFGDDEVARRITPLIRKWPGESRHQRAKKALDVLAIIGTDVALMHLHGISQKLKFKALKEEAGLKIEQIAQQRGLTGEELADRLVPDLDLDEDGTLTLDYGPRQFIVGFDEQLNPVVRDSSGKVLRTLPKPGKADDAEIAGATKKLWSGLKKDAKTVAKTQLLRMELGMTGRRRWDTATFNTFMVQHPLLIHLVRRLVWGVYGEGGVQATFRVAEDRTLSDLEDEVFELASDATVGIPHRLELQDTGALEAWSELFADYEILQPFPQLAREVYTPSTDEKKGYELNTVLDRQVHFGKVMALKNHGWRSGYPQDAGCIWDYFKPMHEGYEAELTLDPGMIAGDPDWEPMQKLSSVVIRKKGSYGSSDRVPLSQVDPMLLSELIRDLENMVS